MKPNFRSQLLAGLGMAAVMLYAGAGTAHAQRPDAQYAQNNKCAARVQKAQNDLNQAINRYGYDSKQALHERSELQKDAQKCGYSNSSSYYGGYPQNGWGNQDRDDRRGYQGPSYDGSYDSRYDRNYDGNYDNRGYSNNGPRGKAPSGYYNNGGGYNNGGNYNNGGGSYNGGGYNNHGFDVGYRDGLAMGQNDGQKGKSFRLLKNGQYGDANHGYNKNYGDKNQYKNLYRQCFQRGYSDGYRQRR